MLLTHFFSLHDILLTIDLLLKYYQNELELSTVTVSHTLEPRMAGHVPMKVKLSRKKPKYGPNLFSWQNVHWVFAQQFTVQENCVGSLDRAQLKFILIILYNLIWLFVEFRKMLLTLLPSNHKEKNMKKDCKFIWFNFCSYRHWSFLVFCNKTWQDKLVS